MTRVSFSELVEMLPESEGAIFSPSVFSSTGIFVLRNLFDHNYILSLRNAWEKFYAHQLANGDYVNRFNPVSIDLKVPDELNDIYKQPLLLDVMEDIFGSNIALYGKRFVIKDRFRRNAVFLHNDSPYHYGWLNKASAFVALTPMTKENGGMYFYPGTWQFGYLTDAGELDQCVLRDDWPVISPNLEPGDVVLMHSATWHGSHPFESGPNRILADIIYQPSDDPSGVELLRGNWKTELRISNSMKQRVFKRSRVSRLIELQEKLDKSETLLANQIAAFTERGENGGC